MAYLLILDDNGEDDGFPHPDAEARPGLIGGHFQNDYYQGYPDQAFAAPGDLAFTVNPDNAFLHPALPAPQDFGQSDEVAFVAGVYADGTLPLYAFSAWNDDKPATYTGGFTNTAKWGAPTAQTAGGTIDYYFTPSSNWSATEQQFLSAGLALWSDVANISFVQTTIQSQAQIVFTRGSNGSAATSPQVSDPGGGGHTGGSVLLNMVKATISIDTSVAGFGPIDGSFTTQGGYPIMTFLHEEGHALGLGHAGPYNGTVDVTSQQFSAYDTRLWSIMSYIEPRTTSALYFSSYPVTGTDWGFGPSGFRSDPTGLMPLDILAAQALYGAPASTPLSGGQVFGFHCNVSGPSEMFFDFSINTVPILTLFDMGTGNTLDLSGYSTATAINLNPGTFSSFDGMVNNLGIAFGTKIDSLIGSAGNDIVTANNDGDTLTGGAGNDNLTGGAGNDIAVYSGNYSDYTISFSNGIFTIADHRGIDGTDTLNQVESAKFADTTVALNANATPQVSAGGSVQYVEQASPIVIAGALTVTDADSANLAGATATISAGFVTGDVLDFTAQSGITGSYNVSTHVLTLSGTASVAAYQSALRSVTFFSPSDDPTNGSHFTRTVGFAASDGNTTSPPATATVNIGAVDDAPVLGGAGNSVNYTPLSPGVVIDSALTVADPDNAQLLFATVAISSGFFAGDVLNFTNQHGISGSWDPSGHILSLQGSATVADYQTAMRSVTFSSSSSDPTAGGNASRSIDFNIGDGQLNSNTVTSTIGITGGDAAPSLGGAGNTVGYVEQAAPLVIDGVLTVSDSDNATLAGATVTISSGFVAGDTLGFANQNGISGSYDSAAHVLTLSGSASLSFYQTALRSVTFFSGSDDPTAGGNLSRTIGFSASDGTKSSAVVSSTINVTPVDDPPQLHDDNFATTEAATAGTGLNVFNNNGWGTDVDPDGPALHIVSVNGNAAKVGVPFTLPSGALLTLNSDGTFVYNPNHAFDYLAAPGSGATDTSFHDTFTYNAGGPVTATANVVVTGADSNDTLLGTPGNDTLSGGIGNDTYIYSGGFDSFDGGPGSDTLDMSGFKSAIYFGYDSAGIETWTKDTADLNHGSWRPIVDANNVENVVGTAFNDTVNGNDSDNTYVYTGGFDTFNAGNGSDTLDLSRFGSAIYFGYDSGGIEAWTKDTADLDHGSWRPIVDANNVENVVGTAFNDTVNGNDSDNTYVYTGGFDTFNAGNGSDTLDLSRFGSAIYFGYDSGGIEAWTKDTADLDHGSWRPIVDANNVENVIGTAFNDTVNGNDSDNTYVYTGGFDTFNGGNGSDTLDLSRMTSAIYFGYDSAGIEAWTKDAPDLNHGSWRPIVDANSVENVIGSAYDDTINGDAGTNRLTGGAGNDTLTGAGGDDHFIFNNGDGLDTITDFSPGDTSHDIIELHGYAANSFAALQPFMAQIGADTVIAFDAQNHIVLQNVTLSALTSNDFIFS